MQATAQNVAGDQFMVETDCPYLAPAPDRGKRCEPAHTRRVADFIADLRGEPVETLAARTTQTARAFFNFARAVRGSRRPPGDGLSSVDVLCPAHPR